MLIVSLAWIAGCSDDGSPSTAPAAQRRLIVPDGGADITLAQRSTEALPGSDGRVLLTIDDITRGQVITSISTEDGEPILSPVSIRATETVRFTLDQQAYALTLKDLHNVLIGTDTATFVISEGVRAGLSEPEVIDRLIDAVANLRDAVLVRNDKDHTPTEAAEHLRTKWRWMTGRIETAEDFIRVVATGSSVTDKPYLIRFADGRELSCAAFLSEQLAAIRAE